MIGMAFYGILNSYSDVPWSDLWHNNIVLLHNLWYIKSGNYKKLIFNNYECEVKFQVP